MHGAFVGAQRPVGTHEHVLQYVFGVLARSAPQHLAHVREQALAIAVMDHAERLVVARAEQGQELVVGAHAQQWAAERQPGQAGRCVQCSGFHGTLDGAVSRDSNCPAGGELLRT